MVICVEGVRPLGYVSGAKPGSAIIDKKNAPIIKDIFKLCLEGYRPYEIAKEMNFKHHTVPARKLRNGSLIGGGKSFSENYIRTVILNPFYCGYVYATLANPNSLQVEYELFDGKHDAIITKEEWQKAVNLLKSYNKEGHNYPQIRDTGKYLLKGVLRCNCGSFMSAASTGKVDDNGEKYRASEVRIELAFFSKKKCLALTGKCFAFILHASVFTSFVRT